MGAAAATSRAVSATQLKSPQMTTQRPAQVAKWGRRVAKNGGRPRGWLGAYTDATV